MSAASRGKNGQRFGDETIWKGKYVLITGGGGYFGLQFCRKVLELGATQVRIFDLRCPESALKSLSHDFPTGVVFIEGDIRKYEMVKKAVTGTDIVYHVASFGMSGGDMLRDALAKEINVGGTKNVIQAALESYEISPDHPTTAVIFTSTCNVIFNGVTPLLGVDETYPYPPLDAYMDAYSKTKRLAEEEIINANGKELNASLRLSTCSLRSTGIYGEGEERHFGRVIKMLRQGLCVFSFGDPSALTEWVYIGNLVYAHLLAGEKLLQQNVKSVIAGKTYFISDWEPVNQWEFFRPLIEGLGYTFPRIRLPESLMFFTAWIFEIIFLSWIGRTFPHQPFLTRMEVAKITCPHYFSVERAKKELGYEPLVKMKDAMARTVKEVQILEEEHRRKCALEASSSHRYWILLVLVAVFLVYVVL